MQSIAQIHHCSIFSRHNGGTGGRRMMSDAPETDGPTEGGPFIKPRYLKRKVLQLAKGGTKNFYDLARSLATLHEMNPGLLKTVEDSSKLSRRTLYYLVDVGRVLRRYQID